jgi:hypothetical protein
VPNPGTKGFPLLSGLRKSFEKGNFRVNKIIGEEKADALA